MEPKYGVWVIRSEDELLCPIAFLPAKTLLEMVDIVEQYPDEKYSKEEDRIETGQQQEELVRQGQSPEEKKLVRKLDNRILPIACLLYLFACES